MTAASRLAFASILAAAAAMASAARVQAVEPGMALLSFELPDVEGKPAKLDDLRSGAKLTAIVFWATWSESSLRELKQLAELAPLQEKGLRVLAVNAEEQDPSKEQLAAVGEAAKGFPPGFITLLDDRLTTFGDYAVSAVPTTFLADDKGLVVFRLAGFPVVGGARMLTHIREAIEGHPAPPGPWVYRPNPRAARYFNLARVLYRKGDPEMSAHTLRRAAEVDPGYIRPHALLGDIEKAAARSEEALVHYARALEIDPKDPQVLAESGDCLLLTGKIEEGLDRIRLALAQESDNGLFHAYLALGLDIQKKDAEADAQFERAMALAPRDHRILALRARAYERRGLKTEALTAYWRAYDMTQASEEKVGEKARDVEVGPPWEEGKR